jgi:subtilisin family serine protease
MTTPSRHRPVNHAKRSLLAVALAIAFGAAHAKGEPAPAAELVGFDTISEKAQQQIESLLKEKRSRSGEQRKIASALLFDIKHQRGEKISPLVERLALNERKDKSADVLVDIRGTVDAALLQAISSHGGTVLHASTEENSVRATMPLVQMEALATRPEVQRIKPAIRPQFNVGAANSEGDTTHRAALARSTFGVNGSGVKIGVLSDSVRFLARSQASGDLPPNVTVLPGQSGIQADNSDLGEGTALLEIIHDIAPGAQLFYATAINGAAGFADNIRALRAAGCDIIVDDARYLDQAVYTDDVIAKAIDEVTASGALYFSSAGNLGNAADLTSGVWEGDFSDGGAFSFAPSLRIHQFSRGVTFNPVTATGFGIFLLSWSDPINASSNDYDLFVLTPDGSTVVGASTNIQDGNDLPLEGLGFGNSVSLVGYRLVITKEGPAQARALHLNNIFGRVALATGGVIYGHAAAANAIAVGATPAAGAQAAGDPVGPFPQAHNPGNVTQRFSSDGFRRVFFNSNGQAYTPGNFRIGSNGGQLRLKPEVTAADGVKTSFPQGSLFNPFFGTSASAPHAAAIAALVKSARPARTAAQIRAILFTSTIDIETPGADRVSGYGILDAFRAVEQARR